MNALTQSSELGKVAPFKTDITMRRWSFRRGCVLGLVICMGLMGYALYAQYVQLLNPCPLCIFQRIGVIGAGLGFLFGALLGPSRLGRLGMAMLVTLASLWGIGVAGRHLWIQALPADQVPSCGPGLGYLLDSFPWTQAFRMVLTGSGECAKIETVLGLPMPTWTLAWFVLFLGAGICLARKRV